MDLVLCGHEHNYERSLPVRGVVTGSETLTPNPVPRARVFETCTLHRRRSDGHPG
ncbi:hypothetical protein ACFYZ8_18505 [Streptomyces sp. NPDC001668]|uniref:hypothetical protein n=1 Tax=unclassified Streptomyces TaxID=2593676 RepID=UPI0033C7E80D